eukprot:m.435143 g.435143  ORF g.435143 m.435143 type:complete len:457 (-) comp17817_c0_seq1:989-2359(-)
MVVARSTRMLAAVFAAGILVGIAHVHVKSHRSKLVEKEAGQMRHRRTESASETVDRNLAYWDSATATAQEIKEMVKQDLQREYGLDEQSEMLIRLLNAVRALQDRKHHWETKIRTTPAPTPRKKPSCVNNPPFHYQRTGDLIKECKTYKRSRSAESTSWIPTSAYILSLKPADHPAIAGRIKFLEDQGLVGHAFKATDGREEFAAMYGEVEDEFDTGKLVQTYTNPRRPDVTIRKGAPGFLTPGELGYLATMERLIKQALADGTESLIVLDDDAVLDCSFRSSLDRILNNDRCSAPIRPDLGGPNTGVLLLGAAIWIEGSYPERGPYCSGWRVTDAEMSALRQVSETPPLCFNAHSKTFGSYGAVYHRSTFKPMLEWMTNATEPFDHIYPALMARQKLVRVAYPNLVIQDVTHVSQIDPTRVGQHNFSWRANIHRWEPVGRYCDPITGLPLTHDRS